ncbi:hypothetical protein BGW42_005896 [Actinomortierella wolfii]|nr:hypothetical protein BGW42_005896 [Actinomortierella wolfii]
MDTNESTPSPPIDEAGTLAGESTILDTETGTPVAAEDIVVEEEAAAEEENNLLQQENMLHEQLQLLAQEANMLDDDADMLIEEVGMLADQLGLYAGGSLDVDDIGDSDYTDSTEEESDGEMHESYAEQELKQRAAFALSDPSTLLLHAITMNESPSRARLRAFRHLTGQPQLPIRRPSTEDNDVDGSSSSPLNQTDSESHGPLAISTTTKTSTLSQSSLSPTYTMTEESGAESTSPTAPTFATSHSSHHPSSFYPVDEEFASNYFQGEISP